jgi:hypothetical protein
MYRLLLLICLCICTVSVQAQKKQDNKKQENKKQDEKKNKAAKTRDQRPVSSSSAKDKASPPKTDYVSFKTDSLIKLKDSPKIEVVEIVEYMSQGQRPGLKVMIPSGNTESIEKSWKDYIKIFKGKTKKGKDEYFTDNATLLRLSSNPIDIYSRVEETANGTSLKAFFDLGGAYLSSKNNADKYPIGEAILRDFAAQQAHKGLSIRLDKEESKLSRLADARKAAEIEQQSLELDIERMKETIRQHEQTIEKSKAAKNQLDLELQHQITQVEQIKKDMKSLGEAPRKPNP